MHEAAPRWAVAAKRAMDSHRKISYWWYGKQDPDTGIGFDDDDTESILVAAPTLVLCQDDQKARHAFRVLCEQMWRQWGMDGDKEVGYPSNIETGDIEHAAEPISFSQPAGMLVEPGNPVYVERCLISARNLLHWTGINEAGHRHFKAFYFGAGGVKNVKYYDCDIPMNARAVIPAVYAAWYNRDPELMRILVEYADAWVEHAMDTSMGKPLGVVPSEIRFGDDKVGGYSGRWDQIAGYRQFDWSAYHRSAYNMYYFFISMYMLTGDDKYLAPVRETIKHLVSEYGIKDGAAYAAMYRNFTCLKDLDPLFEDLADEDPLWKWFLRRDPDGLADWCDSFADRLESTMAARTVDLDLRDPCANYDTCLDDGVLRLMYTGGLGYQVGAYPFVQVSWEDVDNDFAALVLDGDKQHLSVLAYTFGNKERTARMVVWHLQPGDYDIEQSDDRPGAPVERSRVTLRRWDSVPVKLTPGVVRRIDVRLVDALPQLAATMPDLAVSVDDLLADREAPRPGDAVTLSVTVHNIGSAPAENAEIEVRELPSRRFLWQQSLRSIPAPTALTPSRVPTAAPWVVGRKAKGLEVSLSQSGGDEVAMGNNVLRVPLDKIRREKWVPNVHIYRDPPPPEHPMELVVPGRVRMLEENWSPNQQDWREAPVATLDQRMYSASDRVSNRTEVRALWDPSAIYILFMCRDPDPSTLKARLTERDSRVWDDESIEITLDPRHDHMFYYHLAVNSLGTMYDAEMVSPFWNGAWTARVSTYGRGWKVQVTLPFETFGISSEPGAVIGINFIRTNYAESDRGDRQTSIWQPVPGWTLRPAYFGHLRLG